ncbi:hypothetical protein E4U30_007618, partial [Claviceps sp. LM220 group G6]
MSALPIIPKQNSVSFTLLMTSPQWRSLHGAGSASWYFAYCNFNTSGVKSFADDLAVRNGPVSSRVALLLRSAEGKPSFASISQRPGLHENGGVEGEMRCGLSGGRCRVGGGGVGVRPSVVCCRRPVQDLDRV